MTPIPLLSTMKTAPAVFAVGHSYQIMVPVNCDTLFWVTVNGRDYYDHSNGIIRSAVRMHRVSVPMSELDRARAYTVHSRKIIERKPYFTTTEEPESVTYPFRPLPESGPIRIYHLSDTHGHFDLPIGAARCLGDKTDLLVLNGDIPDHSGDLAHFDLIYRLCESITGGMKPCIFSRGNHDTRGIYAENIADYTPTDGGRSYFTFRLGRVWGLVLDCGEDKPDDHEAYGHTNCCHAFREEETAFLHRVADAKEYEESGIEYRLVIAHHPFTHILKPPFDIEQDIYGEWARILKNDIRPNLMLSGHLHTYEVSQIGGRLDDLGQSCPIVVASTPVSGKDGWVDFIGCAITLDGRDAEVVFDNSRAEVVQKERFPIK